MAPITTHLFERGRSRISSNTGSSSGFSGGGIGGIVAGVLLLVAIVFLIMYWSEYSKAKRLRARNGTPISHGKIFKKSALVALTLGLVSCLCAEACGLGDNDGGAGNGGGGGGGGVQDQAVPQMGNMGGGGFVQQPQPTWQPQMDNTPIQAAAVAPVL